MWKKTDPRDTLAYCRTMTIIVVAPRCHVAVGTVETNHGWHIDLNADLPGGSRSNARLIGEHDKWPDDYYWTTGPEEPAIVSIEGTPVEPVVYEQVYDGRVVQTWTETEWARERSADCVPLTQDRMDAFGIRRVQKKPE